MTTKKLDQRTLQSIITIINTKPIINVNHHVNQNEIHFDYKQVEFKINKLYSVDDGSAKFEVTAKFGGNLSDAYTGVVGNDGMSSDHIYASMIVAYEHLVDVSNRISNPLLDAIQLLAIE